MGLWTSLDLGLCSAVPQRGRRTLRHRRPGSFEGRIEVHGPQAQEVSALRTLLRVSQFRQLSVLIFFLALPEAAEAQWQTTLATRNVPLKRESNDGADPPYPPSAIRKAPARDLPRGNDNKRYLLLHPGRPVGWHWLLNAGGWRDKTGLGKRSASQALS